MLDLVAGEHVTGDRVERRLQRQEHGAQAAVKQDGATSRYR